MHGEEQRWEPESELRANQPWLPGAPDAQPHPWAGLQETIQLLTQIPLNCSSQHKIISFTRTKHVHLNKGRHKDDCFLALEGRLWRVRTLPRPHKQEWQCPGWVLTWCPPTTLCSVQPLKRVPVPSSRSTPASCFNKRKESLLEQPDVAQQWEPKPRGIHSP